MAVGRRSFLGAIVALVAAPWVKPDPWADVPMKEVWIGAKPQTFSGGIEHFIQSNVWEVPRALNEQDFVEFLETALGRTYYMTQPRLYFSRVFDPESFEEPIL